MRTLAISLSIIAMILASPAHAEFRTLPGVTDPIAVTRIGCSVVIDGKELMNGTCHHRLTVFMTLPEAATQIVVNVSRQGWSLHRVWLWTQTPDGKQLHQSLGSNTLVPQGECQQLSNGVDFCPCWANERVRICSWPLTEHSEQAEPPTMFDPAEPPEMFNPADPPKQYDPDQEPGQF